MRRRTTRRASGEVVEDLDVSKLDAEVRYASAPRVREAWIAAGRVETSAPGINDVIVNGRLSQEQALVEAFPASSPSAPIHFLADSPGTPPPVPRPARGPVPRPEAVAELLEIERRLELERRGQK